jgi:hypothetical protein
MGHETPKGHRSSITFGDWARRLEAFYMATKFWWANGTCSVVKIAREAISGGWSVATKSIRQGREVWQGRCQQPSLSAGAICIIWPQHSTGQKPEALVLCILYRPSYLGTYLPR